MARNLPFRLSAIQPRDGTTGLRMSAKARKPSNVDRACQSYDQLAAARELAHPRIGVLFPILSRRLRDLRRRSHAVTKRCGAGCWLGGQGTSRLLCVSVFDHGVLT